jgi:hypothetical protein
MKLLSAFFNSVSIEGNSSLPIFLEGSWPPRLLLFLKSTLNETLTSCLLFDSKHILYTPRSSIFNLNSLSGAPKSIFSEYISSSVIG